MRASQRICKFEPFKRYSYEGQLQHPRYVVEQLNILALGHIYDKDFDRSESNLKKALKISTYHTNEGEHAWTPTLLVWTLNSLAKACNVFVYHYWSCLMCFISSSSLSHSLARTSEAEPSGSSEVHCAGPRGDAGRL
jgi:hypothetical protein